MFQFYRYLIYGITFSLKYMFLSVSFLFLFNVPILFCIFIGPIQAYIEDRNTVTDSSSFGDYHTYIKNFKLKCIPSGWFIKNSMHWFKDGVLLDISSSELSFDISSTVSTPGVLEYQGYYSCSVDQIHPIKRVYSSDYLLKIPGIKDFLNYLT